MIKKIYLIFILLLFSCKPDVFWDVKFILDSDVIVTGKTTYSVKDGESVKAPVVTKNGFRFVRWDKNLDKVETHLTVFAIWEKIETAGTGNPGGGSGSSGSGNSGGGSESGGTEDKPIPGAQLVNDIYVSGFGSSGNSGLDEETPKSNLSEVVDLIAEGGTIHIVDNVTQTSKLVLKKGVKFTSNSNKEIVFRDSLVLGGDTSFENLNLAFIVTGNEKKFKSIYANGYNLTVNSNVTSVANLSESNQGWPYLYAGAENGALDREPTLLLNGGSWEAIYGGGVNGGVKKATVVVSGNSVKVRELYGGPENGGETLSADITIDNNYDNRGYYKLDPPSFIPNHNVNGNKVKLTFSNMYKLQPFDLLKYSGVTVTDLVVKDSYISINGDTSSIKYLYVESGGKLQIRKKLKVLNNFYGGGNLEFGTIVGSGMDAYNENGFLSIENEVFGTTAINHIDRNCYNQSEMIDAKTSTNGANSFTHKDGILRYKFQDEKHFWWLSL